MTDRADLTALEELAAALVDVERIRRACTAAVNHAHQVAADPTIDNPPARHELLEDLERIHDYLAVIHRDGSELLLQAQLEVRRALGAPHPSQMPA